MGRGCLNPALLPSLIAGFSGSQLVPSQLKMFQMCRGRTAVLSLTPEMSLHHFSLVIRAIITVSLISISLPSFSCHQILHSEGCTEDWSTGSARCLSRTVKAGLYLRSITANCHNSKTKETHRCHGRNVISSLVEKVSYVWASGWFYHLGPKGKIAGCPPARSRCNCSRTEKTQDVSHVFGFSLQGERGSMGEGPWLSKASPASKHKAVLQHLNAPVGLG